MGKPTECVRAMLDEFGIHWWAGESEDQTRWESRGLTWEFEEGVGLTFLGVCENDVTPEQAIAATLCEYTYEQWRAINEIVGNAMEYAHDVAIMHPDKADPCWDLSNYVDQILEVAYGDKESEQKVSAEWRSVALGLFNALEKADLETAKRWLCDNDLLGQEIAYGDAIAATVGGEANVRGD